MTLEEAIIHCEEVAEENTKACDRSICFQNEYNNIECDECYIERCNKCASEHRQLAEWLRELMEYRKNYTCFNCYNSSASFNDYPCCECRRCFKALDGIKDHYEEVNADDT